MGDFSGAFGVRLFFSVCLDLFGCQRQIAKVYKVSFAICR